MVTNVQETTFGKVARWVTAIVAAGGFGIYLVGFFTEFDRLLDDVWEDGIVLGLTFFTLIGLGALRTFKPHLPRWFHVASAFALVVVGYVIIMLFSGIFNGRLDKGAEIFPFLLAIVYGVVFVGLRVRDFFDPPLWSLIVVVLLSLLSNFIPSGAVYIATTIAWIVFLGLGFWQQVRKA